MIVYGRKPALKSQPTQEVQAIVHCRMNPRRLPLTSLKFMCCPHLTADLAPNLAARTTLHYSLGFLALLSNISTNCTTPNVRLFCPAPKESIRNQREIVLPITCVL